MPPVTTIITFSLAKESEIATIKPQAAEAVFPVDDNIPGKINAPKAAKGMKPRKVLSLAGSLTPFNITMGIIRGIYVTKPIANIKIIYLSILIFLLWI
jgi:hypothetical protein